MLVNQRGIFLKQIFSKMFERLNMNRIQDNIKRIDLSQAGSRPNRGTADQTFLLRASIDHAIFMKRPLYIVLYDYSQCFDALWLEDCLLSLWKLGVQDEILSLIRELNKECNIIVKTPVGKTDEFSIENIVQQGSVFGGTLCSASTGEASSAILCGGNQIGKSNIKVLVYVDDIVTTNTAIGDVCYSHDRIKWFSRVKRLSLSVGKCIVLCVNLKETDVIPRLYIDNTVLPVREVAPYLGDEFNSKGTNVDLVSERVKKGKSCIVNSMALCSDVTMGIHALDTMLLLYRSLFLQVILNNAQSWTNLTKTDQMSLQRVQLKYLKRMFHSPSSTSNPLTYLETGTIPIKFEIHIKQLTYLHHIITLEDNDPVKFTYHQQLQYIAPNWANEVRSLREKYNLSETDDEVALLSKEKWKQLVKDKVYTQALAELNLEAEGQKYGKSLLPYNDIATQEYITTLKPKYARKVFHIRTRTIDLRGVRRYTYGDNTSCRLCDSNEETVHHVVNECPQINRLSQVNTLTSQCNELEEMAKRCVQFATKVEEKKQLTELMP